MTLGSRRETQQKTTSGFSSTFSSRSGFGTASLTHRAPYLFCATCSVVCSRGCVHYLGCLSAIQSEVGRYAPKNMQPKR